MDLTAKIEEMSKRNVDQEEKELRVFKKQLDSKQDKLSKYKAEVIKVISGDGKFSDAMLNELIEETKLKICKLESQLEVVQKEINSKKVEEAEVEVLQKYVPAWREVFEQASNEKKKMMLSTIIGCVRVFRGRVEIDLRLHSSQFLGTMGYGEMNSDHSIDGIMDGKVLTSCSVARNA